MHFHTQFKMADAVEQPKRRTFRKYSYRGVDVSSLPRHEAGIAKLSSDERKHTSPCSYVD